MARGDCVVQGIEALTNVINVDAGYHKNLQHQHLETSVRLPVNRLG